MSSSEDARIEAFEFFKEWMKSHTKLFLLLGINGIAASSETFLVVVNEVSLVFLGEAKFKFTVFLEGCKFSRADPQRDSLLPNFEPEALESLLFKIGWEISLPSGGTILVGDCDS